MVMTHHVSSSIEPIIASYDTNSEMCNELKCIDSMCYDVMLLMYKIL